MAFYENETLEYRQQYTPRYQKKKLSPLTTPLVE